MLTSHLTHDLLLTGALAGLSATLVNGCLRPESQIFGRTIVAGKNPMEAALTYDDGPNDAVTYDLLELLAQHNTRATFFMIGKYVRQRPDMVRAVHNAGHLIGNHTMSHPWLAWQSTARIRQELADCNHALEDALGAPVHYMRPPHGARRPAVIRIARDLGLKVVQWNVMGWDWEPIGVEGILKNIEGGLRRARSWGRGANILLHDGSDIDMGFDRSDSVTATARLLQRFTAEGRQLVTVDAWG
jgi:peptidoglycan/xylan/chitin deacetylase (PgdA/CDA1 family)